ncbi:AlpA family transcriptional regulator [Acinetobacter sp. I-MWF]|uniref:helix-turn-helix transcriptional regulator n=1 Tax=Acinetobacter sp. I-MWF TaxID=2940517 RepID=UPI0021CACA00|nr:AlpA family transcriptional regulator [Acinetobacter sp. I-MWF]MCT9976734.1 AlpA family transcriptional regulator [Acinetobacter sp. I-MWF]
MIISKTQTTENYSLICRKQVQQITGLNLSEIQVLMKNGLFPQSIQITKRLLWDEKEINHWIQKFMHSKVTMNSELLFQFNLLNQQFNEASDLASLASRNLIYYGKKVKPRLRKQLEGLKDQLQLKLI